jgi:hypothetical protein
MRFAEQDPIEVLDDSDSGGEEDTPAEVDAEAEREAFIAEARRKLAELEADRPLWEEEAKKRAQREKEEQEARRSRMAEQRRAAEAPKAEEARRARVEKEKEKERQQQQQARAREEARVRAGEERARRDRERRQRNERWAYGPWTTQRALERYKVLSDIFDSTKFSADDPITFDVVPWPMLAVKFSLEDIDWAAVEGFFNAVKPHMRSQGNVTCSDGSRPTDAVSRLCVFCRKEPPSLPPGQMAVSWAAEERCGRDRERMPGSRYVQVIFK